MAQLSLAAVASADLALPESPACTHPIQEMMSRTGSFPLSLAIELLVGRLNRDTLVLDPFCGKGTTLLAGRLLGSQVAGLDIAPEAFVCSIAKQQDVTLADIADYISSLRLTHVNQEIPAAVRVFFAEPTLQDLLAIRRQVLRQAKSSDSRTRSAAQFTLGTLLGILHGHASYSLSIRSAHAYSMAPAYVTRYAREHGLTPPVRDVKECLLLKARRLLSIPLPPTVPWSIKNGSALKLSRVFRDLRGRVDVILTSPPYLRTQTYAKDNWLRLWFLGYEYKLIRKNYIETSSVKQYEYLMQRVLFQCVQLLKPGGTLICIAGDIRRHKKPEMAYYPTALALARSIANKNLPLRIVMQEARVVSSNTRYLHALSQSNGHTTRSLIERHFIATKSADAI